MKVTRLKIIYALQRMRAFMLREDYIGAYNCLLDTTDELYNDIKYKDAINDWKQMSKDIRNVK